MTVLAEDAELEILDWLLEPPKLVPKLRLRGSPGSGKTALLAALHEELPDSLFLDCRGLTAEEVLGRLLAHFDLEVRRRPLGSPLEDTLAGMRRGGIVFLANVQWAGRLYSPADDSYGIDRLASAFSKRGRGQVLPVLESSLPSSPAQADGENEILLEGRPEGPDPAVLLADHPALRTLAMSELREVPLRVWAFLDAAVGGGRTEGALRRTAQQLPDAVHLALGSDGAPAVRLASDALKYQLREAAPITDSEHRAITEALLAKAADSTADALIATYARRALAVHAALSGALPQLIEDQPVLTAVSDRVSLQQAIKLAWPSGPPVGGVAADAHYLDGDGVTPDSHGEWLAWLHWAAVNRDRRDWADELENVSPEPLAWRTAWSRWRPYGILGQRPDLPGVVHGVDIGISAGTPVVASQYDGILHGADSDDLGEVGDVEALEQVWRLADGAELFEPRVVQQFLTPEGRVVRTAGSALDARSSDMDRQRWPGRLLARCGARAAGEGRWVVYGPRGLYAFDALHPHALDEGPSPWRRSLVPSFRSTATWPMPTQVAEGGEALITWFSTAFGDHALRSLPTAALPAGLTDPQARATLCDIGFPALDGTAPAFLTTLALDEAGLGLAALPNTPDFAAPFYLLGHWLTEPVLLDGHSGRVLLASGSELELLGSSLSQFMTLVGLYRPVPLSGFPRRSDEAQDARHSVRAWAKKIDPEAAASSHWHSALGGYLDDPGSL